MKSPARGLWAWTTVMAIAQASEGSRAGVWAAALRPLSLIPPPRSLNRTLTVSEWSPTCGLVGPGHPQREQPDLHSGDLEQGQHSQRAVQGAVPSPRHPEEEVQWKRKFSDQKRTGFQPRSGFPSPGLMPFFSSLCPEMTHPCLHLM